MWKKSEVNNIKAIVYLPLKPEVAKRLNLPLKLPVLAEDLMLITDQNNIPLDVILRGLEEQYSLEKDNYWLSYLVYFYYEKFKQLLNAREYDGAGTYLQKAKELSYDYRYHFYNALLQTRLENYDIAEIEFKQALVLNPNFPLAHYELGNLLFSKQDYDEALEEYTKAYQLEPDFLLPLLRVGDIYVELSQLDDAELVYKTVIQRFTTTSKEGFQIEPLPEAYLRLGVVYNLRNQYAKAESTFKEGLKIEKRPEMLYNLAHTLTRLGKHFEAYNVLYELSKDVPTPEVLNEMGIMQRRLGLYDEAYETFERVKDDFPENFERIQFYVGKKNFEDEYPNEMKKAEAILEGIDFPFADELDTIIESTDGDGGVLIDKFVENTGISVESFDNLSPNSEYVPFIFSGMYIAGVDPIMMEKNATLITIATMGAGLSLACTTTFLRLYQYVLSGEYDVDHFLEETSGEIEELHFDFSKRLIALLEQPMDDFFYADCEAYDDLVINLIKAIAYQPSQDEIEQIEDQYLAKIVKFLVDIQNQLM
ncbi:MAG TPA: hypothetical protein DE117_07465 [Fervidobacterium sp.]|nr:hypothetical protein [Fervidobacterium sp.]HRD19657.1 tetratricopeptide repeat protein [Fervidobacterium sp.]